MKPDPRTLGEIAHTEFCLAAGATPCWDTLGPHNQRVWSRVASEVVRVYEERRSEDAR